MTLSTVNKTLYQGVDDSLSFAITDDTDVARDVFGATFNWTAYHNVTGDILQKTLDSGISTGTDPTKGIVTVSFTADEMTVPPLTYTYQLFMTITVSSVTTTTLEATGYMQVEPNRILDEVVVA